MKIKITCEKLTTFHVNSEDEELIDRIIKMCNDYNLNYKIELE